MTEAKEKKDYKLLDKCLFSIKDELKRSGVDLSTDNFRFSSADNAEITFVCNKNDIEHCITIEPHGEIIALQGFLNADYLLGYDCYEFVLYEQFSAVRDSNAGNIIDLCYDKSIVYERP
jgi:hypothetical protein